VEYPTSKKRGRLKHIIEGKIEERSNGETMKKT
jgi:hypothetical protein